MLAELLEEIPMDATLAEAIEQHLASVGVVWIVGLADYSECGATAEQV
jgi:hypothetical protein